MKLFWYALFGSLGVSALVLWGVIAPLYGLPTILVSTWFKLGGIILGAAGLVSLFFSIFGGIILCDDTAESLDCRREWANDMTRIWGVAFVPHWLMVAAFIQYDELLFGGAMGAIVVAMIICNNITKKGYRELMVEHAKKGTPKPE